MGAQVTEALDLRIRKRIASLCMDCASPAVDSDYCEKHYAKAKARDSKARRSERRKRAEQGLCRDGCGKRVPKRRRSDGALMLTRCVGCKKEHTAKQSERRAARGVVGSGRGVIGDDADPALDPRWRADPNKYGDLVWNRYRGKGRRGRLTREEQAEEDKRDARFAIAEIEKFIRAVDVVISSAVQDLPRIQRDAARRQAADPLRFAGRLIDDLADRYGAAQGE
jgi:hypothetical protein